MLSVKKILAAGVALGSLAVCDVAMAQSLFTRDRNVSVLQRSRPEYDAPGIRAGSFILRPKVDLMAGYSDNVFAIDSDTNSQFGDREDSYFIFRPSIRAESNWNRHAFVLGTYAESRNHADFNDNDILNAGVFADGRLDVRRQLALTAGGSYDLLHESRKATNSAFLSDSPVEYRLGTSYLGIEQELGRVRYRGRLNYRNYDFMDARDFLTNTPIDQDFRDRDEYSVLLQGGFAVTRDASVFVRTTFREREYAGLTPGGLDRDSQGWTVAGGIDFDITRLARGSIAVGYMEEEFDDPALPTIDGVSVDAGIEWFPTETVTARLTASRAVRPSALINSGGYIASDVTAGVDVELARNFILSGTAGYGMSDYEDIDREETRYGASLGATYLINRYLRTALAYTYEQQDVESSGIVVPGGFIQDYETNEVLLTLTAER